MALIRLTLKSTDFGSGLKTFCLQNISYPKLAIGSLDVCPRLLNNNINQSRLSTNFSVLSLTVESNSVVTLLVSQNN